MKSSIKEFIAEAEELLEESQRLTLEINETISSDETIDKSFRNTSLLFDDVAMVIDVIV